MAVNSLQLQFGEAPITAASRLICLADHDVVRQTSSLGIFVPTTNDANGASRVEVPYTVFQKAFCCKLRTGQLPADKTAAERAHIFNARLSEPKLIAWMDALIAANVFSGDTPFESDDELQETIRSANMAATDVEVSAAHWALGQQYALPAGAGAAATELRATLRLVRFMSLATVALLEDTDSDMPWTALATAMSAVGPVFTQQSRGGETSRLQIFASLFRAFHTNCTTDGALAMALRDIASDTRLPSEIRPLSCNSAELYSAVMDGLYYNVVSKRRKIEERRILRLLEQARSRHL
jgi:hypothetical protein